MAKETQNNKNDGELIKLRRQELGVTQEIMNLRKKLESLSARDLSNIKEIEKLKKSILNLETKKSEISKKLIDSDEKVKKIKEDTLDTVEKTAKKEKEQVDLTKEHQKQLRENKKILNDVQDTSADIQNLTKQLLKDDKSRNDLVDRLNGAYQVSQGLVQSIQSGVKDTSEEYKNFVSIGKDVQSLLLSSVNLEAQINESRKMASQGMYDEVDVREQESLLRKINIELEDEDVKLTKEKREQLEMARDIAMESIDIAKKQNEINEEAAKIAEGHNKSISNSSELLGGLFDKTEGLVSKLPGGDKLLKVFGFEKMKSQINENLGGTLTNVINGFKEGGVSGFKALGQGAMQFGKTLLMGPQAAIFGILAAVALVVDMFMDLDGAVSEVQKELGGTKKEALAAHEAAHDMAHEMNLVGVNTKEVVKGMSTVSEIMGGIDVKNMMQAPGMKEMVKDATLLSEKFGMSKEEIENVHTLSTITGKSMSTLAGEAIQVAGGVMKTKDAVKLLGGISKDVAISFKGGTKELIAAAAKAKLLGTDLKKVKDIGMGMLDIETSLEKEMEARAILGRDINLDRAREAALSGDVATLQDELLTQAGSLKQFQDGGPLKQKALADAMGMTVEEMTDMLTKAEEMNKLGLDKQLQEKLANATAEEKAAIYKKQAETLQGEARDLALRKAAEEESASTAEKFGDIMTKIKETAMKLVTPILDMVHGLMDGATQGGGLLDVFDGIISTLKPIMEIIFGIGKIIFQSLIFPFKLVFSIVSPIIDAVKEVFSAFSSGEKDATSISDIFDGIAGVMSTIQDVVGGIVKVFIGGLIEPGKILWKSIITPLWETFKGIYDTLSKAFEPLFAATGEGEKTAGVMETIKKVISSLSPVLEVIGGLIAGVIMKPFEMFANLIQIVIKLFTGDMTGAVDKLGEYLFDYFLGIPEMVITAVSKIIDGIFGTNLTAGVTDFFAFIKDGFKSIAGLIEPIFGFIKKIGGLIIDNIMAPFKFVWGILGGIGKMFTGDFMGGLKQIGSAITEYIMTPINFVKGLFEGFVGLFTGIADKIKGVIKDLLPGWALDILGLGEESAPATSGGSKSESVQVAAAAKGGEVAKGGMMLVGEKGPEIVTLPQGASVASTSAGEQTGGILSAMGVDDMGGTSGGIATSGNGGGNNMSNVEKKLDTLITLFSQAANQPTVIKFGDKTVEEIKGQLNFKKAYTIGTDNSYGRSI
jgi:phage-related protein